MRNRPVIKIPLSKYDRFLETCILTGLFAIWMHTILIYPHLPEHIPVHFNLSGEIDRYGDKAFLWLLPAILTALSAFMYYLNKHPHLYNYTVTITAENAFKLYKTGARLIRYLRFAIVLVILLLHIDIVISVKTGSSFLGAWFIPAIMLLFIIPVAFHIIKHQRINKVK